MPISSETGIYTSIFGSLCAAFALDRFCLGLALVVLAAALCLSIAWSLRRFIAKVLLDSLPEVLSQVLNRYR